MQENNNIILNLKDLIAPILSEPEVLTIESKKTSDGSFFNLIVSVSSSDMHKIIGNGGRNYRSIKTLIKNAAGSSFSDLVINVAK
jgi:predicted RNA-binding protein YlqC (UPF0109 family)